MLFNFKNNAIQNPIPIEGLTYVPDYINERLHDRLIAVINEQPWRNDLKRRVQHYGYIYDYRSRSIKKEMYLGELPEFCAYFARKFHEDGLFSGLPDQVIVNEYEPSQGIAAHIDCEPCFEDTIISMSLGSACVMNFTNAQNPRLKQEQILLPKSILVLKGEARYEWKHGIAAKKSDTINGLKEMRGKRISLTFRKVIL